MSTLGNPFAQTEAWEVSLGEMLPKGNHVVKIVEAEEETNSKGNPTLVLKFENEQGSIKAWEHYHEQFLAKIVALYQNAGLAIPQEGEFDLNDHCRLGSACRRRLVGRTVGIVVRDEPDNRPEYAGQTRLRVVGYADPTQIKSDIPADTTGLPSPMAAAAGQTSEADRIPF